MTESSKASRQEGSKVVTLYPPDTNTNVKTDLPNFIRQLILGRFLTSGSGHKPASGWEMERKLKVHQSSNEVGNGSQLTLNLFSQTREIILSWQNYQVVIKKYWQTGTDRYIMAVRQRSEVFGQLATQLGSLFNPILPLLFNKVVLLNYNLIFSPLPLHFAFIAKSLKEALQIA